MKISTHLISGAGNTFHIVYISDHDFLNAEGVFDKKKEIATNMSSAYPADGFIYLTNNISKNLDNEYKWYFYNKDGSDAEMCGNATRCVGYYIKNVLHSNEQTWFLLTRAGKIKFFIC